MTESHRVDPGPGAGEPAAPRPTIETGVSSPEISPVELANALLKKRWFIFRCSFWVALLVGVAAWAWPDAYTVTAAFTLQSSGSSASSLSSLSGLAAQFGVSVSGATGGASPDLYVTLIQAPMFLLPVVESRYAFVDANGNHQNATYADLYDFEGDTRGQTMDMALTKLIKSLAVSDNATTGVVTVSVSTDSPALSTLIAKRLMALVDSFNLATRQQQAKDLETFTDVRLAQSQSELHAAEDSLAQFLERNRNYADSPRLAVEHDRLQRVVTLKQGVYMTLVQTYEQARIDAVRNTPSIVAVQPAVLPLVADKKHLLIKGLAALVGGAMLGLGIALAQYLANQGAASDPESFARLRQTVEEVKSEAKTKLRRLKFWRRKVPAQA